MVRLNQYSLPSLVRIKPGALDRIGIYLHRLGLNTVWLATSQGMLSSLRERVRASLGEHRISCVDEVEVAEASFEQAVGLFSQLKGKPAVVGLGGGRALDVAKYVAFLSGTPFIALPTSLSNDGFCSPQVSLTVENRRRSLAARLPLGVVLDTAVCLDAPRALWLSGVGDLVAKLTATFDWKRAFHCRGELVDDFASLLSDATVYQFIARPRFDLEGARLLGTSLMLNGIAMEICGSSRPASGSEHLISHAYDQLTGGTHLHGLQVGMATYLISRLQGNQTDRIASVFEQTGFWDAIRANPFQRSLWLEAVALAPEMKSEFHTILSECDGVAEIAKLLESDPLLRGCFV
jgi:glycerol-1-phosphate dehydrogenase [NAD(P)+]